MQLPGTLIEGKYEILGKLREGGMGTIYRVRHRLLDEIRVVKVLKPQALSSEEMKRRFVEEARTATRLKHANIGTIHDFALDEEGKAYLVMEFIDGINLADLLKRQGSPGIALSLEIAHQTLLALGYLHRKNVVHRDIAPDNLMLTQDEEGKPLVKLIDLGIAKALDRPGEMTTTGVFLGKLKYASPEQFGSLPAGEKLDGRCDLYALGVVLYELLTGVHPFVGESPSELLRAHLFDAPLAFSRTDPDARIPPELRTAVLKALEKKRDDRFASAEEFDREVVLLQQRFSLAADLDETGRMISNLRVIAPLAAEPTVTPSAQDLLDRQFVAASTPHPSRDTLRTAGGGTAGAGDAARISSPGTTQIDTQPLERPPKKNRLLAGAVAAVVLLAALALLRFVVLPRSASRPAAPAPAPTPERVAVETAPPPPTAPAARPTAAAEAPAALPAPTAAAQEPSRPAAPEVSPRHQRAEAEQARSRAAAARRLAERASAPRRAAALFDLASSKEREARDLFAAGDFAGAAAAFGACRDLFANAEEWTRVHPAEKPTPEKIAALPAPTVHTQPPASVAPPTVAPAPARAATALPPPAEAPRGERATDEDRIRETIRGYEKAQSTLDADLYARVYPVVDKALVRAAFAQLRSQTLELEIQKIELAPGGRTAVVHGLEKRAAVPLVGSEQHAVSNRVITLEKRGDSWVITRLSG